MTQLRMIGLKKWMQGTEVKNHSSMLPSKVGGIFIIAEVGNPFDMRDEIIDVCKNPPEPE
jgi:hypothetical protein